MDGWMSHLLSFISDHPSECGCQFALNAPQESVNDGDTMKGSKYTPIPLCRQLFQSEHFPLKNRRKTIYDDDLATVKNYLISTPTLQKLLAGKLS